MSERSQRLSSLDLLRGLVMVLMALDHVRDFYGDPRVDPTQLDSTTPVLFLTRWVTHFCAPVFVFLAGTSAYLHRSRSQLSRGQLSRFLITRGLWLILLEFTVVSGGWLMDVALAATVVQVIAAIGVSMIALAGLIWLPHKLLVVAGLTIVVGHNLLDPVVPEDWGPFSHLWTLLHEGPEGGAILLGEHLLLPQYPLLPWIGVMTLGYGLGSVVLLPREERRRELLILGLGVCTVFVVLRWSGLYGDPPPWIQDGNMQTTWMSFLNVTKYPPSLLFLTMTLGPLLVGLSLFDREPGALGRALIVFGRVPLFYYVLHMYLIHVTAGLLYWIRDGEFFLPLRSLFRTFIPPLEPLPANFGNGNDLVTIYLAWAAMILLLYPACRWYGARKRRGTSTLWSYL